MVNADFQIRRITRKDAEELAVLCAELGYPSTSEQCIARISVLEDRLDQQILGIAETGEDKILGFVHVRLNDLLEVDRQAEVAALVVREGQRGRGLGRKLLEAAEVWASEYTKTIVLRSRIQRVDAHEFYRRAGFTNTKTSYTFSKSISKKASPPKGTRSPNFSQDS